MTHALNIVWNPSEGIDLGFFIIRYYSLMFVIAFGLGWYIMKNIFDREGESIEKLDSLFIWTVLATLIGSRLGEVLFYLVLVQTKVFRSFFKFLPRFIFPWNIFNSRRAAEGIKHKIDYFGRTISNPHDVVFPGGKDLAGHQCWSVCEIDVYYGE